MALLLCGIFACEAASQPDAYAEQLAKVLGLLAIFKVDFEPKHKQPTNGRLVLANDHVRSSARWRPTLRSSPSAPLSSPPRRATCIFGFSDYAKLTIVGVIIACAGWPIVTRVSLGAALGFFDPPSS